MAGYCLSGSSDWAGGKWACLLGLWGFAECTCLHLKGVGGRKASQLGIGPASVPSIGDGASWQR